MAAKAKMSARRIVSPVRVSAKPCAVRVRVHQGRPTGIAWSCIHSVPSVLRRSATAGKGRWMSVGALPSSQQFSQNGRQPPGTNRRSMNTSAAASAAARETGPGAGRIPIARSANHRQRPAGFQVAERSWFGRHGVPGHWVQLTGLGSDRLPEKPPAEGITEYMMHHETALVAMSYT